MPQPDKIWQTNDKMSLIFFDLKGSYLLVEVHVLHLGFEQLHFGHSDGVLKALLCSCRTLSIFFGIHIEHRATTGKHNEGREIKKTKNNDNKNKNTLAIQCYNI